MRVELEKDKTDFDFEELGLARGVEDTRGRKRQADQPHITKDRKPNYID